MCENWWFQIRAGDIVSSVRSFNLLPGQVTAIILGEKSSLLVHQYINYGFHIQVWHVRPQNNRCDIIGVKLFFFRGWRSDSFGQYPEIGVLFARWCALFRGEVTLALWLRRSILKYAYQLSSAPVVKPFFFFFIRGGLSRKGAKVKVLRKRKIMAVRGEPLFNGFSSGPLGMKIPKG